MNRLRITHCVIGMIFLLATSGVYAGADTASAPWKKAYTGSEATGKNVIALWQFKKGEESKDNSGNGHDLKVRGKKSRFVTGGLFGNCLESFPGGTDNDVPHGAYAKNHPSLTPPGAFTIEMWIKPKGEFADRKYVFLLDKKLYNYAKDLPHANRDYCIYVGRQSPETHALYAWLGFGKDSVKYKSSRIKIEVGKWQHVAFTYDGAGAGRFYFNGALVGRTTHKGRGPVKAGKYPLVIGDRVGSTHGGFPGFIDQVRISKGIAPGFEGDLSMELEGSRTSFRRMENAGLELTLINDTHMTMKNVKATVVAGSTTDTIQITNIEPSGEKKVNIPVNTKLRAGTYSINVDVTAKANNKAYKANKSTSVVIVNRRPPLRMPVVLWSSRGEPKRLKEIGFTHHLIWIVHPIKVFKAGKPTEAASARGITERSSLLNRYLAEDFGAVGRVQPGVNSPARKVKFARVDRAGKPYTHHKYHNVCGLFPEIQDYCYNTGASVARTFGKFPALEGALVHSEIRDSTAPCFHKHDREAFKKFAGYDIPKKVVSKSGVNYENIPDFPNNRIIPDNDPLLTYYRWFWKNGDGWNILHTKVHKGLKSGMHKDFWTFFDPAVRVPSVWGSGGGVDYLSQWTYSYPDPIKMGQATDEMFAMAEGGPEYQQVMKMTQVIWYRSGTAPNLPKDKNKRAAWEKGANADARFITIAPDHMSIAFWSKIARPVRGIMYHGFRSLNAVKGQEKAGYRFTNPDTMPVLTKLVRTVVEPLGPTLLQVEDGKSDIAILETFAAQMYAHRGTRGWSHKWEADMHLILQWARYQPKIIYDETVLRDGLDNYKVLVMPFCDVLTESVYRKVREFQRKGGIIVADEFLAPALIPDIMVSCLKRSKNARKDKKALQGAAERLRAQLAPFYKHYADSSNPDVIVRTRRFGETDYLFAINDKRTYGDYVGHHLLVMEKGLHNSAQLTLARGDGYVYDLVAHKSIPVKTTDKAISFNVDFGPGVGRLFMISPQEIKHVIINAPGKARRGKELSVKVAVTDGAKNPVKTVIPIEVTILDPEKRISEFSGYYGAKNGVTLIKLHPASNAKPGKWVIRVSELASGLKAEHKFNLLK